MSTFGTIAEQFCAHVRRLGDGPCLLVDGRALSWREVDAWSDAFASRLAQDHGVGAGDTVGLLARNTPELVVAFLAAQKVGAITSCLNTRVSAAATLSTIELEQHRVVVCGTPFADLAEHGRIRELSTDLLIVGEGDVPDLHGRGDIPPRRPPVNDAGRVCNIIHTSGTTGDPKGASFTHTTQTLSGLQYALEMGVERTSVGLAAAPIVIGAATNFFACFTIVVGAPLVLVAEPSPATVINALERYGVTALFAVPTQLHQFLAEAERCSASLRRLRTVRTGGSPVRIPLIQRVRDEWGADVLNTYGTTESCTAVTVMHSGIDPERVWSSIGKASYLQETKVEVEEGVEATDDGRSRQRGQLLNRGPQSADTVYLRPERGLKDAEGWQHTRDVVEIDEEGYLYIIDRADNVIISGGENIYPQAIEQVIGGAPSILDVGVGSMHDDEWGEIVVALVVSEADTSEDLDGLVERRCLESDSIPRHWRPRVVLRAEKIPRNILGKVDRDALDACIVEQLRGEA